MKPLFNIEPKDYIVPILHLLIGIVNKGWTSMGHFLDEFVEQISEHEAKLKDEKMVLDATIEDMNQEIDIHTVSKNMALLEMTNEDGNQEEAKDIYKHSSDLIKKLILSKRKENNNLRLVKSNIEKEKQKRSGNEMSIDNLLYDILTKSNIKRQQFHGGTMNGVCCRRLLDNVDVIFEKIMIVVSEKLSTKKTMCNEQKYQLTEVVSSFKSLFECIDVVFSKLRILDPTVEEIKEIENAIKALERLWIDLDLNVTPKMHILTTHTVEQVVRFGGIADKVEDFIEKSHQIGKRLDHLVARMNSQSFRQQELVKIRRQWLSSDPSVSNQVSIIRQKRKRNINHLPNRKPKKMEHRNRVKAEKRDTVMKTLLPS